MSFKTIVAHCNDHERLGRLLEVAAPLSAAFGAHLVGVSVAPPVAVIPAGMPGTPDAIVIEEHTKAYKAKVPAMKAAFEKSAHAHNITCEWREADAGASSVARVVGRQARTADLVIALQTQSDWGGSLDVDIADRLALESGRPVLILPNAGSYPPIPKRIVVAWTDRREAVRAVFDALPLLQCADTVMVVEVDPEPGEEIADMRTALCTSLRRDGVNCAAETLKSQHRNVGDTLLACCERTKADLLVMGCYGHSRLREFVLGGATRHMLAAMTLPILMAH
jgi:nucleotide-binding universal stress UspA family protein